MLCVNPTKLGRLAKGDRRVPAQNQFNPHQCKIKKFSLCIRVLFIESSYRKPRGNTCSLATGDGKRIAARLVLKTPELQRFGLENFYIKPKRHTDLVDRGC
jgi:hypothetical protein